MTPARASGPATGDRAVAALEALLAVQRTAMVAGDVTGLESVHARIHALLSDPAWRRDAARARSRVRVRAALKTAAINAGLAARGEAQSARALATLGGAPGLYTANGSLGKRSGPSRGIAA